MYDVGEVAMRYSQVTPKEIYLNRRRFLAAALALPIPAAAATLHATKTAFNTGKEGGNEKVTSQKIVTTYNNFYEFGTGKGDPAQTSAAFHAHPWSVEIAGHAEVTGRFTLEDLLKPHPLEERIYRMRCVEGWSMVMPWVGIGLGDVLKRFKPTSNAKFIALTTVNRPAEMPGMRSAILDWPYREGLRIDEAMHPLALLAVGLYGHELPNQNGAPLRLVVPWKYGFKGAKSIVRIEFVETQPKTTWNELAPDEYGFYANVNPAVDHPRWSQKTERRIAGEGFNVFGNRTPTLPFNGYGDQVASLYAGMDLRRNF